MAQVLTAGHDFSLQLVPGQVEHPKDSVVQEDKQHHQEEVPHEVEDLQDVKHLLPAGQDDGACMGWATQEAVPQLSFPDQTPACVPAWACSCTRKREKRGSWEAPGTDRTGKHLTGERGACGYRCRFGVSTWAPPTPGTLPPGCVPSLSRVPQLLCIPPPNPHPSPACTPGSPGFQPLP